MCRKILKWGGEQWNGESTISKNSLKWGGGNKKWVIESQNYFIDFIFYLYYVFQVTKSYYKRT